MKKSRTAKKASETPASHNGIYRLDEISAAFKIPKSVVYLWTIQEKLVAADYPGRSRRPSLFLEKSAAAILLVDMMMRAGITKENIKKFMVVNAKLISQDGYSDRDRAVMYTPFVNHDIKVGAVRKYAHALLVDYVTSVNNALKGKETKIEVQKESRNEGRAVSAHHEEPVEGAAGLASV